MVGVSLGSMKKLGRWIGGLNVKVRAAGAIVLVALIVAGVWGVNTANSRAALLRMDPDLEAMDAVSMKFALGRGHGIYEKNCASCHGGGAKGDQSRGVPDLTDNDWLYGSGLTSDIETVILYGIRAPNPKTWRLADMPAFARPVPYAKEPGIKPLSPGDINDMVQFLASLRGAPFQADAAGRGAKLFSDRGGCYDCHGDTHGDSAIGGPNLADNIWLYGGSDKTVFQSIAYGRAGFCPSFEGRLSPAKIREAALYVYSLSHQKSPSAK